MKARGGEFPGSVVISELGIGPSLFPFERADSVRTGFGGLKKKCVKGNQGQSAEYKL